MKKIIALILLEILIVLSTIAALNLYIFQNLTLSIMPIFLLLKMSALTGFTRLPMNFIIMLGAVMVFLAIQFVIIYQSLRKAALDTFKNRNRDSQGTARWAEEKELKKAGLLHKNPKGLVFGQTAAAKATSNELDKFSIKKTSTLISDDSPYHTLVVGATGAGKFVGVIASTLLCKGNKNTSMIIVDPKSESYRITAGYRSQFSDVYYFNPTDEKSCHINPLDFIPLDSSALTKIKNICKTIHPDKSKEPYWDMCPQQILEMLIGFIIIKEERKSLTEVVRLINTTVSYKDLFNSIILFFKENPIDKANVLYPIAESVLGYANHYLEMAKGDNAEQLITHFSAVKGDLSPYSTPEASASLSYSDFSLEDICDGKRPISIYFCCDVDSLTTVLPMFKLVFSLVIRSLLHSESHKYRLYMFLDEFSQFEKFEIIQKQITYVRSFGIRIIAFIQSIAQLKELYGHDGADALLDNFQLKLYLKATNADTGTYFERLLGTSTLLQKKTSFSNNRKSVGVESWTESTSEVNRPLLKGDEILRLPNYEELIFHPNIYPYRAKKIQYFSDKRFTPLMNLNVIEPEKKNVVIPEAPAVSSIKIQEALKDFPPEVPSAFTIETPDPYPEADSLADILEELSKRDDTQTDNTAEITQAADEAEIQTEEYNDDSYYV